MSRHNVVCGDKKLPLYLSPSANSTLRRFRSADYRLGGGRSISDRRRRAQDVSGVSGDLSKYAVGKSLFLDIVGKLNGAGIDSLFIPSKLEGITFGQDILIDGATKHTLYVANDNDFLGEIADPTDPRQWDC
jgi:hypothetical protein